VVRYTIRFIGLHGLSKIYQDKIVDIEIEDFKGLLPCDLISIIQVKDLKTGVCLRSMTDNFAHGMVPHCKPPKHHEDVLNNAKHHPKRPWYIPPMFRFIEEPAFKTQGRIIYTSFPEGSVRIAYKAVMTDEDGFPMIMDNEVYLDALESYITLMVYRQKFRNGKINANVLQEIQQSYAVAVKLLDTEMTTPSYAEAEAMSRYMQSLIPRVHEFDKAFRDLGRRQIIIKH
jgi:hypothetical protein